MKLSRNISESLPLVDARQQDGKAKKSQRGVAGSLHMVDDSERMQLVKEDQHPRGTLDSTADCEVSQSCLSIMLPKRGQRRRQQDNEETQ